MSREIRARIAKETLEILGAGFYLNRIGNKVDFKDRLEFAVANSILYKPYELDAAKAVKERIEKNDTKQKAVIEITAETTLAAAGRLINEAGIANTACLNFASAKNPGGGFLNGSQAQEESLSRASGLYPCIAQMTEMYDYNKQQKTCLYSDYIIYSPKVPVIRDDNDSLLDQAYEVSIITAPAVNAGVVREREPENREKIDDIMIGRIQKILAVAAINGSKAIVLGAYGCGVFRNEARDVAGYFRKVLVEQNYQTLFETIVFAIYESSGKDEKLNAFKKIFD